MEGVEAMEASMEAVEASRHSLNVVEVYYNRWKFTEVNGSFHGSSGSSA